MFMTQVMTSSFFKFIEVPAVWHSVIAIAFCILLQQPLSFCSIVAFSPVIETTHVAMNFLHLLKILKF